MILSSYALLSEKCTSILGAFTSAYGKRLLSEALDDLSVIQDYANHRNELYRYDLDIDEIADIAYSYHVFKQTGQLAKCIYAAPGQAETRFGEPSANVDGEYTYSKFEPFNMQSVWQFIHTGEGDFPVEEEFNIFAKEWLTSSRTLKKIRTIKALGYDDKGNFGYNKELYPKDINPKTLEVLERLLQFAAAPDPFEGTNTRVGYTLNAVQEFLSTPEDTKIIFDSTYNRLNQRRVNEETGNDGLQALLYDRLNTVIRDLGRSQANLTQQLEHIFHDSKVILDARFKNVASNKESFKTVDGFLANIPEDITLRYGKLSNEAEAFIAQVYQLGKSAASMPKSTLAILELYLILQQYNYEMVNMLLGVELSIADYVEVSKELYHFFGIPFYYGDAESDLAMLISNGYGIAEEEDKFDKPQPQLVDFACIVARSAQSKTTRLLMEVM